MNHTEPTTLIQYRCEYCGDAITEARPGWMEFDIRSNRIYLAPPSWHVTAAVHHDDCGDIDFAWFKRLPKWLKYLQELELLKFNLQGKNWCNMVVMETLNSWEPVSNDAAKPPIGCESTNDDGDDSHVHKPADRSEKTGDRSDR